MLTYRWVPLQIMRHMLLHAKEVLNATKLWPHPCLPTPGYLWLGVDSIPTMIVLLLKVLSRTSFEGTDYRARKITLFSRRYKEKQRVSNIFNENGVLFTWKPFQTYTIYHLCTYKRQVVPQKRVSIISFVGSFCIYGSVIYKWNDVYLERLSDSWPRLKSCETGLINNLLGNQLNRLSFINRL